AFESLQHRYETLMAQCLEHHKVFLTLFLLFCVASLALVPVLGRDFFPAVDAGQFRLHVRAKTGTRIEETARQVDEIDRFTRAQIPVSEMGGILDNIGLPTSGINLSYSNTGTIANPDA